MLPLVFTGITSTNAMIKRLGGKRWRALHRPAYVAAIAGVILSPSSFEVMHAPYGPRVTEKSRKCYNYVTEALAECVRGERAL
jgi:hypothetical protein